MIDHDQTTPEKPDQNPDQKQDQKPETSPAASPVETPVASPNESNPKPAEPTLRPLPAQQLVLPVVPVREGILFPSTESVLNFGREISVLAIQEALKSQKILVLVSQRKASTTEPTPADLYQIGTLATVERTLDSDDQVSALVRGIGRVKIIRYLKTQPSLLAQVVKLEEQSSKDDEQRALAAHLQKEFRQAIHLGKPVEFLNFMKLMGGVTDGELVDQIASTLNITTKEKQRVLEVTNVKDRLRIVIDFLAKEMKVLEIEKDVVHKTQAKFDKSMRENVLRERLRTIQKELGDIDDEEEVLKEYQQKLKKTKFPVEVKEKVAKEIKRLKQMSVNNPEAGYVRTWLDTMFELPWGVKTATKADIKKSEEVLNTHHYGLKDVKDRVLEYIAVMQLKEKQPKKKDRTVPTILCFVGPPGVGKTSIGRSIAEALGRQFTKISLGGVRDEADIRGHRRTYIGAMPGRIINGIKQAKTSNPVFMLDEVDKLGNDFRGDPSAALLEALDPEQNHAFEDHYLDVPFDLSDVIFITTANTLDTIPAALRDRLEIIPYTGYTQEEKFQIANQYLLKKVIAANGLQETQVELPAPILEQVIERYTREAGVRNLERTLSKIMRKVSRELVSGQNHATLKLTQKDVKKYLGPEMFDATLMEETDQVGLSTGLAWTSVGGDVLFIEVALTPGKGLVKLTGTLGDVMKESAQAALTYVKSHSAELGIDNERLNTTDVHIHIPEGAVPKDGPSAGITMTTAIVSAFTNKPVRRDVAMTGEVTLRGRVMRIGGLKEKAIAAHRAGVKTIIIPAENERDLVDIPDTVKKTITFKPVSQVDEVLAMALKTVKSKKQ